ncbi:MAG TPA: YceK/YidQ family lipoprotein [Urbifossiella sp.]
MARYGLIPIVVLSLSCQGCGTCCNLIGAGSEERAFGGVRFDVDTIGKIADGESLGFQPLAQPDTGGTGVGAIIAGIMILGPVIDIPLSLIGDTVTYPLARWIDGQTNSTVNTPPRKAP